MNKYIILLSIIVFTTLTSNAQINIGLFGSDQTASLTMIANRDVTSKISYFNFTHFDINYEDREQNNYSIFQAMNRRIIGDLGISFGGTYADNEFSPHLGLGYQIEKGSFQLDIFPGINYSIYDNNFNGDLQGVLIFNPKLSEKWNLYTQFSFDYEYDFDAELNSSQQVRIGLERKSIMFGVGADLSPADNDGIDAEYGIFLNKEF